ncbi:MAG: HepT-like ribonuclease domain-containing protein [Planctomycetota bacterium]
MPPEPSDNAAYLADMLFYAEQVVSRMTGATFSQFQADDDFRLATERRIELIGEAARHITQDFQDAHPEIPWRPIIAQRHILAHEYGEVIDEKIWRVATQHIPSLIDQLVPLVPDPPEATE